MTYKPSSKPDRPVGIRISGKSTGNVFKNVNVIGDADALQIEDEASENTFVNFTHVQPDRFTPRATHWWERPVGIAILTILCGLIVTGLTYFFGWAN